jgi:hypothetical protein
MVGDNVCVTVPFIGVASTTVRGLVGTEHPIKVNNTSNNASAILNIATSNTDYL